MLEIKRVKGENREKKAILQWHCKGQEFDPPYLHHFLKPLSLGAFIFRKMDKENILKEISKYSVSERKRVFRILFV